MTRKKWTPADDVILRREHARGMNDIDCAYIMGCHQDTIWVKRTALGLPHVVKRSGFRGKHTEEVKAKIAASNARRWQDPEFRASRLPALRAQLAIAAKNKFRRPPMNTPEGKRYRKLADTLGPAAARAEFGRVA